MPRKYKPTSEYTDDEVAAATAAYHTAQRVLGIRDLSSITGKWVEIAKAAAKELCAK